jgi:hypothetical protein
MYAVLDEEEMTYTEGGATELDAVLSLIPVIGWFRGVSAVRSYRQAHPSNWLETGLDALSADMNKSTANLVYDVANTVYFVASSATVIGALINAAIIFA